MNKDFGQPLLSLTIPTWNRASFLAQNLDQMSVVAKGYWAEIELIVSDNASTDSTQDVVKQAISNGLPIKYIRNSENIGSDANIAQCFNLATGKYVLILGDDDFLIDGAIEVLIKHLKSFDYGVVCIKPFGFDTSFKDEFPGPGGKERNFHRPTDFLKSIGPLVTLISSCIINKSILPKLDANQFIGSNLVQVHLVLRAALTAKKSLYLDQYMLACKRNNSGGYDFSKVFVVNLGSIYDGYKNAGLDEDSVRELENRFILTYFPFYILRQRLGNSILLETSLTNFESRFKNRLLFRVWLRPILVWPKPFALIWGGLTTLIGRVIGGDLRRGYYFALNRLKGNLLKTGES